MTVQKNIFALLTFVVVLSGVSSAVAQPSSVLARGPWLKLAVTDEGLYRITYEQLREGGWNLDNLDPTTLRLYGYGGGMLPQPLDSFYHTTLPENALWVRGESDGRFDPDDYIVFYGQSADRLGYRSQGGEYWLEYEKNLYTDTTYYFLTVGESTGKRVTEVASVPEAGWAVPYSDDYAVYERDDFNLRKPDSGSGREWYGEAFSSGQQLSFPLGLNGWSSARDISVLVDVLGTSTVASTFDIDLNGTTLGPLEVDAIGSDKYDAKGSEARASWLADASALNGEELTVRMRYQGSGVAYLDKIRIEAARELRYRQRGMLFRSLSSSQHDRSTFTLAAAAEDVFVWDITSPQQPVKQEVSCDGLQCQFTATTGGQLREFAAAAPLDLPQPKLIGTVANQNLKDGQVPNLVIVSPPAFRGEAERLAELRRQHDGLTVRVVSPREIYHEFSSGRQDVSAIRNYLKYLYDTDSSQLRYLLLFGKCSYDYKDRLPNNTNLVPTYESRNSLHPIYSYSSDDYYAFLEDDEGRWYESFSGDHTMDIGVGRLPVKDLKEAQTVVDKLIHYATAPATRGRWRNEVVLVADDGDYNKHQRDADQLAQSLDTSYTDYSLTKIYLDAFEQESFPGGEQSTAAAQRIERSLKRGALIVNFTGHGNETRWTQENIFNLNTINQLRNYDLLPFFVTATCEFGRYDDPSIISGAEQLLLSERGGAIGLVTTTRPVYSNSNLLLNRAFYQQVFVQEEGQHLTVGEVFRRTKNNAVNGPVNRNFSLLGDPSMKLAYPQDEVVIEPTEVLQEDGTYQLQDTLAALDRVRLSGYVQHRTTGQLNQEFNGVVTVEVLDKPTTTETRGNDGGTMQFEQRNSVIHRGRARVRDGQFTLDFVMPKNIVYRTGPGKITSYAQSALSDAHGARTSVIVGGSSRRTSEDTEPPSVRLFLDDTTFVSGGLTGSNTTLLAHLEDISGINITTTSLGQEVEASLVHQETGDTQVWPLSEFYETDEDAFSSGTITYPMNNLPEGRYKLSLRVGDTHNNFTEAELAFVVGNAEQLRVISAYNYPNPFNQYTTFVVDHNRPGDDLTLKIQVIDHQGKEVAVLQQEAPQSTSRLSARWSEPSLRPGVYIAHIIVQSLTDQVNVHKFHKLVISP